MYRLEIVHKIFGKRVYNRLSWEDVCDILTDKSWKKCILDYKIIELPKPISETRRRLNAMFA